MKDSTKMLLMAAFLASLSACLLIFGKESVEWAALVTMGLAGACVGAAIVSRD